MLVVSDASHNFSVVSADAAAATACLFPDAPDVLMVHSSSIADNCTSPSVCNSAYVCAVPIAAGGKCQGSGQGISTYLKIYALFDCSVALLHWLAS